VRIYRLVYCVLPFVATLGWIESDKDLDNLSGIGTGVMVIANLPIMWLFGYQAMRAFHDYIARLKSGQMDCGYPPPALEDLLSGKRALSKNEIAT
jgi:AGCS family alanine or glycine:cation symporter